MYDTNGTQTDTTESKDPRPPTIAELVREVTDNGRLILEFFTDVMRGKIEGAQLCHRMDAAKDLVKFGSEEAVIFIAKYKGIPCGHSTRRRRDSADSCIADERSLVEVTLNAPANLTREFLTVLSGIDEFLMRRLIRAQTADGGTIVDFLYDVMQDTSEGFKTYHRLAAARELIVHILRDEHDYHTPPPSPQEAREPVLSNVEGPVLSPAEGPALSPSKGEGDSPVVPAHTEGNPDNPIVVPEKSGTHPSAPALSSLEESADNPTVVPAEAGTHPSDPALSSLEEPAHNPTVVPAEAGTHPSDPALSSLEEPADNLTVVPEKSEPAPYLIRGTHPRDPEPGSQPETKNSKLETHPGRSPPW